MTEGWTMQDGSQIRRDPVVPRWVIIAPGRADRRGAFVRVCADGSSRAELCPFCPGREEETPPEIMAVRDSGADTGRAGWKARVVPNKYGALSPVVPGKEWTEGPTRIHSGSGVHEIIIETPEHGVSLFSLAVEQIAVVLGLYADRLRALKEDTRWRYVSVFKNWGTAAGASIAHAHSQVMATPWIPWGVNQELHAGAGGDAEPGECAFCRLLDHEHKRGVRWVAETDHFVAVSAVAARVPYECWILPREHGSHFEALPSGRLEELAWIMKAIMTALERAAEAPPFNCVLHTAPGGPGSWRMFHWHWELIPRTTQPAGFEWGSGCYINPVSPEAAAGALRAVLPRI